MGTIFFGLTSSQEKNERMHTNTRRNEANNHYYYYIHTLKYYNRYVHICAAVHYIYYIGTRGVKIIIL